MNLTRVIGCAALTLTLLLTTARAGIVIVTDTESFTAPEKSGRATVYLEKNRMRIDSTEGGGDVTVIYTAVEEPLYWIIDRKTNSYVELDKEDMAHMKKDVDAAISEFERRYELAPPDQQEYMRKIFEAKMGRPFRSDTKTKYEKVSAGVKVSDWMCSQYAGYRDGKKHEEVWSADWKDLGITPADVTIFGEMASLFDAVGQSMPAFFQFALPSKSEGDELSGFPVLVVTYDGDQRLEKSQIQEVRHEDFQSQLFELPEGLTEESIPDHSH